jgi:asparagine synthase (glutamine-hydrolysing)
VSDVLSESVRIRLRSDVPVGSCLSGGLDSSSIVGWVNRHRQALRGQAEQHAFTFVSSETESDESGYARQVAEGFGVRQHLVQPSPEEVRSEIVRQIWHQDEPTVGLTTLAQWYVFKAARQARVPVLQDGQGGDELFLGYSPYYGAVFRHVWSHGRPLRALRMLLLSGRRSGWNLRRQVLNLLYFEVPWIRAAALRRVADTWLDPAFGGSHSLLQTATRMRMPADIHQVQVREVCRSCLPMLLRYEDRNSMAFSVESRLPMLDPRLVELAVGLPWELKIREGWTKHVFRLAVEDLLPAGIVWRKTKLGFVAPERTWLDHLRGDIEHLLGEDLACRELVDVPRLRRAVREGKAPAKVLWRFFNLEHWLRLFHVSLN